jgi:hypothetical protein
MSLVEIPEHEKVKILNHEYLCLKLLDVDDKVDG